MRLRAAMVLALAAVAATATPAAADPVRFRPCPTTRAEAGTSHLRPTVIPSPRPGDPVHEWPVEPGEVVIRSAGGLRLPDGRLFAGSGPEVLDATAEPGQEPYRVADGPVTARVTRAVLRGRYESLAFVELRFPGGAPVRWTYERAVSYGTDGGDGGFWSSAARSSEWDDDVFDEYLEVFAGNDCVLRSNAGAREPDGIVLNTGGDGGYPSFVGRDARGRVVGVVNMIGGVPWAFSGLPGTPPAEIAEWAAEEKAALERRSAAPQAAASPAAPRAVDAAPGDGIDLRFWGYVLAGFAAAGAGVVALVRSRRVG